jgi:hypothetical protein
MLVFRRKRAPPGPTQVPCPVPLAALRTPPDHTRCTGTTYAGRRRRTDGGRDASPSQSPEGSRGRGDFLSYSRRPSAAAGCARLASLAVLAGQHQDHQAAERSAQRGEELQAGFVAPASVGVKRTADAASKLGADALLLTPPAASADARVKPAAPGLPRQARPHHSGESPGNERLSDPDIRWLALASSEVTSAAAQSPPSAM